MTRACRGQVALFVDDLGVIVEVVGAIGGFGLNWQHCANTVIFPTDSWESWYQMVRRFWRFGQERPVNVHAVASESEVTVIENLKRKEKDAGIMFDGIAAAMSELSVEQIRKTERQTTNYTPTERMEYLLKLTKQPLHFRFCLVEPRKS